MRCDSTTILWRNVDGAEVEELAAHMCDGWALVCLYMAVDRINLERYAARRHDE